MPNSKAYSAQATVEELHVETVAELHEFRRVLAWMDGRMARHASALVIAGNLAVATAQKEHLRVS